MAKKWIVGMLVLFVGSVVLLTMFGGKLLREFSEGDVIVGYVDMARQAVQKRDYAGAEEFYNHALQASSKEPETRAFALLSYAEFLRKRKRMDEAAKLEKEAYALVHPGGNNRAL